MGPYHGSDTIQRHSSSKDSKDSEPQSALWKLLCAGGGWEEGTEAGRVLMPAIWGKQGGPQVVPKHRVRMLMCFAHTQLAVDASLRPACRSVALRNLFFASRPLQLC